MWSTLGAHLIFSVIVSVSAVSDTFAVPRGFILGLHGASSADRLLLVTTDGIFASTLANTNSSKLSFPVLSKLGGKTDWHSPSSTFSFQISSTELNFENVKQTIVVVCSNVFGCETLLLAADYQRILKLRTNLNPLLFSRSATVGNLLAASSRDGENGFNMFASTSSFVSEKGSETGIWRQSSTVKTHCTFTGINITAASCGEIASALDVMPPLIENATRAEIAAPPIFAFSSGGFMYFVSSDSRKPAVVLTRICSNDSTGKLSSRMQIVLQLAPSAYSSLPAVSFFETTSAYLRRFGTTGKTLFLALRALSERKETLALFLVRYDLEAAISRFNDMARAYETERRSTASVEVMCLVDGVWHPCADVERQSRVFAGKCNASTETRVHSLSYATSENVTRLLTMETEAGTMFSVIDLVVADDNSVFFATQRDQEPSAYMLVKDAFALSWFAVFADFSQYGQRRPPPLCRMSNLVNSFTLCASSASSFRKAACDRQKENLRRKFHNLHTCELYQTCQEVVRANSMGDVLECVWCAKNATFGESISRTQAADCQLERTTSMDDCAEVTLLAAADVAYSPAVAGALLSFGILLLLLCIITLIYRRRKSWNKITIRNISTTIAQQTAKHYCQIDGVRIPYRQLPRLVPDELLIPLRQIKQTSCLGQGNFGVVFRATLDNDGDGTKEIAVAVKTLKPGTSVSHLLQEGLVMQKFDHPHVLPLVGISFHKWVPLIVMPFMENGDLRTYLRNPRTLIDQRVLLDFALQVADGMNYLHGKDFVHRDLACRNCMLDIDVKVRIGDFALCHTVDEGGHYLGDNAESLPVKWMAPESFQLSLFSFKTDVWSFGVVLWELMTRCEEPYMELEDDYNSHDSLTSRFVETISAGYRLRQTEYCPQMLYNIMCECWDLNANFRPTFGDLRSAIINVLNACVDDDTYKSLSNENYFKNRHVPLPLAGLDDVGKAASRQEYHESVLAYHPLIRVEMGSPMSSFTSKEQGAKHSTPTLTDRTFIEEFPCNEVLYAPIN